ncbi:hypothetical protein XOC_4101 [Xanthomonas oryzae pv. oryzicola BLS256]|uniref:Uncharacterized protein n=1 Tax=Xanthomonas oryzae pv. oryzicola (strain BLS256) TaxID=383407 RepID=G7TJF9_XANOB|nr:hypothetical protein XOC_4101 [Xanthomonas oryzae pv. oryzicola BLS256]
MRSFFCAVGAPLHAGDPARGMPSGSAQRLLGAHARRFVRALPHAGACVK